MTRSEIEEIRGRSPSWTSSRGPSGPWKTDPMEMWRKTVLKRAAEYAPKSAEVRDAIEIDNGEFEVLPTESEASRPRALLASGRGVRGTLARLGIANDLDAQDAQTKQVSGEVESTALPV
jgi:recombinational DNA repair protein RecT